MSDNGSGAGLEIESHQSVEDIGSSGDELPLGSPVMSTNTDDMESPHNNEDDVDGKKDDEKVEQEEADQADNDDEQQEEQEKDDGDEEEASDKKQHDSENKEDEDKDQAASDGDDAEEQQQEEVESVGDEERKDREDDSEEEHDEEQEDVDVQRELDDEIRAAAEENDAESVDMDQVQADKKKASKIKARQRGATVEREEEYQSEDDVLDNAAPFSRDLCTRLMKTQAQLNSRLLDKDKWDGWTVRLWLANELCLCAEEFSPHHWSYGMDQTKYDPHTERKKFLMQRLRKLGPLFEDLVDKYQVLRTTQEAIQEHEDKESDENGDGTVSKTNSLRNGQPDDGDQQQKQQKEKQKKAKSKKIKPEDDHPAQPLPVDQCVEHLISRVAEKFAASSDVIVKLLGQLFWQRRLQQLLSQSAYDGNLRLCSHILNSGTVRPDCLRGGSTALHKACGAGKKSIVIELVQAFERADIRLNPRTPLSGYTPLHDAAVHGHTDIVKFLVSKDEDMMDEETDDRWTPVLLAVANRHLDIVEFFVWKGARLTHNNDWGRSVIDYAKGDTVLFDTLCSQIPELNRHRHAPKRFLEELLHRHEKQVDPDVQFTPRGQRPGQPRKRMSKQNTGILGMSGINIF